LSEKTKELQKIIDALQSNNALSEDKRAALTSQANAIMRELKKEIENLKDISAEEAADLKKRLEEMQKKRDPQELSQDIAELVKALKSDDSAQDKQSRDKLSEKTKELQKIIDALLEKKKALSAAELKEKNNVSEKIDQAAEIKQQLIMGGIAAPFLEKIEELSRLDSQQAQDLKDELEQAFKDNSVQNREKVVAQLQEIAGSEKQEKQEQQEEMFSRQASDSRDDWQVYILSGPLVVTSGSSIPLKVIVIFGNQYIIDLAENEWSSTDRQVAWVDNHNLLHPVAKGRTRIRVTYKGQVSNGLGITVVESMDPSIERALKQELIFK
jgi:hypothetical protein